MSDDPKIYGIILEWKNEAPLLMESMPLTLEEAHKRLDSALKNPNVIRGAVFKAEYATGNKALLPTTQEQAF